MHIYTYVCVYEYTHIYIYTHFFLYLFLYLYINIYIYICIHSYLICVLCRHITCVYIYTCVFICAHVYINIYTCIFYEHDVHAQMPLISLPFASMQAHVYIFSEIHCQYQYPRLDIRLKSIECHPLRPFADSPKKQINLIKICQRYLPFSIFLK